MPLGETIDGYLDCRNAILRVSKLEALGASGVDTPTNMVKGNSVMLFDDMGSDLANPPFSLGGASRDTSTPRITFTTGAGFAYTGIKLPNAWVGHFDLEFPNTNTGTKIKLHLYTESSSTYANDGYELEFNADGSVKLYYDGGGVLASGSVTFAATTWYDTAVMFDRGTFVVTVGNETIINFEDVERSRVYDNSSGQFLRFAATAANCRARAIKFINSVGGWIHNKEGVMSCVAGNVVVGAKTTDFKFDVRGTANVGALTATSASIPDVSVTGTSQTALQVTGGIDVGKNIVVASAGMVGVGISPEAKVHVHGGDVLVTEDDTSTIHARSFHSTANNRAVLNLQGSRGTKASPTVVQDGDVLATVQGQGYDGTAFQTAVKITGEVDGAAGNGDVPGRLTFHTTPDGSTTPAERLRIDASGQIGINTTSPGALLDVRGTANVGVLSATLPLATLASNLVTYDTATGQLMDSNGLVSNKLAIVSEQPPSALTGDSTVVDGHGRYKVTSSSMLGIKNPYHIFSKIETDAWISLADTFNVDGTHAGSESLGGVSGEWVKLEMPYKTTLRHFTLRHDIDHTTLGQRRQFPVDFKIVASNDDTNWQTLNTTTGVSTPEASDPALTFVVNASASYKFYAIVVEKITSGAAFNRCHIGELRLFTETFTVDAGKVNMTGASGLETGFTEHPVEAMTDYHTYVEGHGTYEASASSYDINQANPEPWRAFDYDIVSGAWRTYPFSNSTYLYTGPDVLVDAGGTRYNGPSLTIKIPYAIVLSSCLFRVWSTTFGYGTSPKVGYIFGSNNGVDWHKIFYTSDFGFQDAEDGYVKNVSVNATTPYTHYAFVCTEKNNSGSGTTMNLNEWRLFAEKDVTKFENVHISGDLSSETIQTGYIKWPKVPLKANESEGYVVDASSANSGFTRIYSVFNDLFIGQSTEYWDSASTYSTSTGAHNNTVSTTDAGGVVHYGEWVQIKLTNAIALHSMKWYPRIFYSSGTTYETWPLERVPKSGVIMGSNDGITWRTLRDFADISYTTAAYVEGTEVKVISSTPYVYYRLVITSLNAGTGSNRAGIMELQLFEAATGVGAAPTSAKLQVAGSLGMAKGSSLFAGDSVVMETPKHDRPLVKYPEVKMTAASTGGYVASASDTPNTNHAPYDAFNNVGGNTNDSWHSETS